ncbi:MAG: hydroxyacylglutathione hydrolase [Rhodospirillales bacterium]|jgi:hydroxyacylglutathione hydrolase|nr:hydroxyacylglutathione hydrolase [Rhodospirillales bacterium]
MTQLDIVQIPVLNDNYIYLAHEATSGATAVIDPAVAGPVLEAAASRGWTITHIINTHYHGDHTGGNLEIKEKTGCTIIGSRIESDRTPGIDQEVSDGDHIKIGNAPCIVFDVPGHTEGHIAFWFEESDALFCGDTLFALGCGRIFEGSPLEMWTSLSKLKVLPGSTKVFCAHEYTQANAKFALSVEPDNAALVARSKEIDEMRLKGIPTVPSTLAQELATNPFLRPDSEDLQRTIGMSGGAIVDVFAETRKRKNNF